MTAITTQMPLVPGRLEQMSTRIAFFIAGFGLAAWAPLVPYAKARAGLDEATLGLLLLCLGAGSIPTGSAVAADLVDIARNIRHGAVGRGPLQPPGP